MKNKSNNGKKSNGTGEKRISAQPGKNPSVWHFSAANSIQSDVFGSYTGTAVPQRGRDDAEDVYPVQDADDL